MNRYTDEYLFKVISKGGSDVGKSAAMPAWGGVLTDDKIREIIVYLRKLAPATPSNSRR
jgi:mono/diheme cytochrome c family protein